MKNASCQYDKGRINFVIGNPSDLFLLRNSYFIIGTLLLESWRPSSKRPSRWNRPRKAICLRNASCPREAFARGIRPKGILYRSLQEYSESAEKSISPLFQERYPWVTSKFLNLDKSKNAFVMGLEAVDKKDLKSTVLLSPSEKNNSTE